MITDPTQDTAEQIETVYPSQLQETNQNVQKTIIDCWISHQFPAKDIYVAFRLIDNHATSLLCIKY